MTFAAGAAAVVVDPIVSFIQPAQVDRPKEDVPGAGGERLQPDGQRGQDMRDVHPALVPADAPIGRDPPELEMLGIRDRVESRYIEVIRRGVKCGGPALVEGLVWADLIEGMPEGVEAALLGPG